MSRKTTTDKKPMVKALAALAVVLGVGLIGAQFRFAIARHRTCSVSIERAFIQPSSTSSGHLAPAHASASNSVASDAAATPNRVAGAASCSATRISRSR
jgi:hypothetical protein